MTPKNKRGPKFKRTKVAGIRLPDPKSTSGKVFAYCDNLLSKGTPPTRKQVLAQFGRTNNPFSIATFFSNWKLIPGNKSGKSVKAPAKAKAVAKKVAKLKPKAKAAAKPAAKKVAKKVSKPAVVKAAPKPVVKKVAPKSVKAPVPPAPIPSTPGIPLAFTPPVPPAPPLPATGS